MATKRRRQDRAQDGRYTFDGDMTRLCTCGHTLGIHAGAAPHDCLLHSFPAGSQERREEAPENDCRCARFRPSGKRKQFP